jgi:two-component system, OmpR family, response regulator RpaA
LFWRSIIEQSHILVIEDDDIVARTVERSLRSGNFHVILASSGSEGLKIARRRKPDLVILDVIMPGMDGYAVCREMRLDRLLQEIPILFLTAKVKDEDKIAGFLSGADDYLCKPFNLDELNLRIRAILRRAQSHGRRLADEGIGESARLDDLPSHQGDQPEDLQHDSLLTVDAEELSGAVNPPDLSLAAIPQTTTHLMVGEYILDLRTFELETPHRGKIRLTPVQFDLLAHMMRHPGEIFTPIRLLSEVWNYPSDTGSPDLVRVHIKNLRERIEVDPHAPAFIQTVPGFGYTIGDK